MIDTAIAKRHSIVLVTIVDRVTKITLSAQVNSKRANDVTRATINLLNPYKHIVHTPTADNGKEFTYHEKISQALTADVYFAHPYSSWERGLNEDTIGLLRQYFPKSVDFKTVSTTAVQHAVRRLNNRPRKDLGFKTPNQILAEHMAALAA